ncbi:hypothetical protein C900_05261 [Fulvivirga imtechensis AK7]|uniref:Uncharacterized protein n=1 Tax=Fulvivirga imtechensis AK7 TaxID=1237149 RepID=L8K184_9BACT|nr:hypothetical protein [Fulvivirga imtechensis]ELR73212.1 hypothetical protein C900_05261 [Fulvivirga imtechensis AK7]
MDGNGNVHNTGGSNQDGDNTPPAVTDSTQYLIVFDKNPNQTYGFDKKEYDAHLNNYNTAVIHEEQYIIPWKSVQSGGIDYVDVQNAQADRQAAFPDAIGFKTATRTLSAQAGMDDNKKKLSVIGTTHENVEEVLVYVIRKDEEGKDTEEVVGKLNVISYDQVYNKVYIVPVNGNGYPYNQTSLANELNRIYAQAAVRWDVRMHAGIQVDWDLDGDGKMDHEAPIRFLQRLQNIFPQT